MEITQLEYVQPAAPRIFPDMTIVGRRDGLGIVLANLCMLGVLAVALRQGLEIMVVALTALIACFTLMQMVRVAWPPRLAIRNGEFSLRYGLRSFRCPAADVSDVSLHNRYLLLTLADSSRVEPQSMRQRMTKLYRRRNFHYALPGGLCDLVQVNQLRAALVLPMQASDPGGDEIDAFHRSIVTRRPIATLGLIAACAAVFLAKAMYDHLIRSGAQESAIAWGANVAPLTFDGQWWRLVTHLFLHEGIVHIGLNMYVLWFAGRILERLIGPAALLLIYFLSGVAGGLASGFWHPMAVSLGASGAVFGVVAALFGLLLHDRGAAPPARLKELRMGVLVFIFLTTVFGMSNKGIDNAAHVGGIMAGFLGGLFIVPRQAPRHWLRVALLAVLGPAALLLIFGTMPRPFDYDKYIARETAILKRLTELDVERDVGMIGDAELADRVKTEVLAPWTEFADDLARQNFGLGNWRTRDKFLQRLQVMQQEIDDFSASARAHDDAAKDRNARKIAEERGSLRGTKLEGRQ